MFYKYFLYFYGPNNESITWENHCFGSCWITLIKAPTLETLHRRPPLSCCRDDESCGRYPHRRLPPSRPGYEGSSAHCWVWSANYVPDPSPPSIRAERHWTSAGVVAGGGEGGSTKWNKLSASSLTLSLSRSSLICWCSCSVSSWSPSWSYLAKMAWISASVWPFLSGVKTRHALRTRSVDLIFTAQTQNLKEHHDGGQFQHRVTFCSPFQVLAEFVKVQFASGLTQTVWYVVYRRLLQSQLHQSLVTTLRERESSTITSQHRDQMTNQGFLQWLTVVALHSHLSRQFLIFFFFSNVFSWGIFQISVSLRRYNQTQTVQYLEKLLEKWHIEVETLVPSLFCRYWNGGFNGNMPKQLMDVVQYLLNEVTHFHLRPLLGHVSLHLRVCVIDDGQEHVLYRENEKRCSC